MAEAALAFPVFIFLVLGLVELGRAAYIQSALSVAAQQAASQISINARKRGAYDVGSFTQYVNRIRFPGAVVDSSQFTFDVRDALNNSTVANNQADATRSTKVIVTVRFPPPGNNSLKVPIVDIGNILGTPIFGQNGLELSTSATGFLERSRRPTIN